METGEVLYPDTTPIQITRSDQWTLVTVHPDSDTARVIQDLAHDLDPDHEIGPWIRPFTGNAIDLRALLCNPVGYLTARFPQVVRTPCRAQYIPPPLQAPWDKR